EMLQSLIQFSIVAFTLLAAVLLLLVVYLLSTSYSHQNNGSDPPGPKPLFLLGNILQLDLKRLYKSLCELAKIYGPVFTVYIGTKKVVVLAGYKTVKQALVNQPEEFGDREIGRISQDFGRGHGIIFSNGENWKQMRRFALSNLRDFGMGKRKIEGKIIEETQNLIEVFKTFNGKQFDTGMLLNYATSNIICGIVYGNRFEYDDPKFKDLVNRVNENIRLTGSTAVQLYNVFPWLGPLLKEISDLKRNVGENITEMKRLISGLQKTLNPLDCRGLIDCFLVRQKEAGEKDALFHEENLLNSVSNLFAAGTDTTGTTLRWGLLLMSKYPHIQDRVQEEIDRVIGGRQPVTEDRKNLPYTDAVIHEIQRFSNIVPLNLPHVTSCDVHFNSYFIKKGTTVFPLLTSVLQDESEWEKPHSFYPEHFLDEHGHFVKRDAFMPFSAGRRICLGEGLAKMELLIFFTSLLQRFRFTPATGVSEEDLDLTPIVGLTLSPSHHELCAISRF
uniref:Cytochrome P450 2K1 n=1 Tax=Denticeps clupeoides TaxID=299321 RepID=A0AAY4AZJ7_9TELE